jgi:hypothetical protein
MFLESETAGVVLAALIMPGATARAAATATSIAEGRLSRFTDQQRCTNDQTGTQNNRLYIAALKIGALLAAIGRPMRTGSAVQRRGYAEPRPRCQPSTAPDPGAAQTASIPR